MEDSMAKMSRRSFIVTASTIAIVSTMAVSNSAQAINSLLSDFDYDIPTAPKINEFNLKLELISYHNSEFMKVAWEIATDSEFTHIINQDSISLKQGPTQALNVIIHNVPENTQIFYRLKCDHCDAYEIDELPFDQGININNVSLTRTDIAH